MSKVQWPDCLKKTKQRRLVLEVLEQAEAPMTATDISACLERQNTPVWLSTVYRVLENFAEHDMVHKTAVLDNGMAVFEISGQTHRHYAVCVGCQRIIPLENCPLEHFSPKLAESDFQIMGHKLQVYGFCKGCKESNITQTGQE